MSIASRVALACALVGAVVWDSAAQAANCASFPLFQPGTAMTVTNYDARGREIGVLVSTTKAAPRSRAAVHAVVTSASGQILATADYAAICAGGVVFVDMDRYLPAVQVAPYRGYDAVITGRALAYPTSLTPGQSLGDGIITATYTSDGAPRALATVRVEVVVSGRQVDGMESVWTPAGRFDAWKIEYDSATRVTGLLPVQLETHVTEWYAPGVGAVKSETCRGGVPTGSSVLTAIEGPWAGEMTGS